eukprot:6611657-Lingulodinium_polyedra.AAC.1
MVWLHDRQSLRDEVVCRAGAGGVATLAVEGQDRQDLGVGIPVVSPRLGAGRCVGQVRNRADKIDPLDAE